MVDGRGKGRHGRWGLGDGGLDEVERLGVGDDGVEGQVWEDVPVHVGRLLLLLLRKERASD